MTCPNCNAPMEPGDQCPECEHDDRAEADCVCDYCVYGGDDSELDDDDLEDDSELDDEEI